jgi:DAPG hydrolase PhiG domain
VRPIAARVLGNAETSARNLLVQCAQEMNHLAGFLPELYAAFDDE